MTGADKLPGERDGLDIVSILIGDGNAIGTNTTSVGTGLPYGATPMRTWLWNKWGQHRAERYRAPTAFPDTWQPIALGTGINENGSTEQTIGLEFTLGSRLIERLKPRCANRQQKVDHHLIKFAAPRAQFALSADPSATWAGGVPGGLREVLIEQYVRPALEQLRDTLRPVYVDALYIVAGEADTREGSEFEGLGDAPREFADNVRSLVDAVQAEVGVESLQTVIVRPRYNEAVAPRVRTDLARQELGRWAEKDVRVLEVDISDLALQSDMIHLTGPAVLGLGMRLAHVWDTAHQNLEPLPEVAHAEEPD